MTGAEIAIELVLVAFLVWVFYRVGYRRGTLDEKRRTPPPPQAICPCTHSIGTHKDGGRCQAAVKRPYYTSMGSRNGHQWVNCACTKYWGPQPVTEFFHPGIAMLERTDD